MVSIIVTILFSKTLLFSEVSKENCRWWGGDGSVTICKEEGDEVIKEGHVEEVFFHEGTHITLDLFIENVSATL